LDKGPSGEGFSGLSRYIVKPKVSRRLYVGEGRCKIILEKSSRRIVSSLVLEQEVQSRLSGNWQERMELLSPLPGL